MTKEKLAAVGQYPAMTTPEGCRHRPEGRGDVARHHQGEVRHPQRIERCPTTQSSQQRNRGLKCSDVRFFCRLDHGVSGRGRADDGIQAQDYPNRARSKWSSASRRRFNRHSSAHLSPSNCRRFWPARCCREPRRRQWRNGHTRRRAAATKTATHSPSTGTDLPINLQGTERAGLQPRRLHHHRRVCL